MLSIANLVIFRHLMPGLSDPSLPSIFTFTTQVSLNSTSAQVIDKAIQNNDTMITTVWPEPSIQELFKTAKKGQDGNWYPPSYLPKAANEVMRVKAGFIVLVRNRELQAMKDSMKEIETRFNHKFGYPWIFLNEEPFTEAFKRGVLQMTDSEVRFGLIPKEHWGYPDWIDQEKAAETRRKAHYAYGKSASYRHMCRYQSGFFFQHPLTLDLDYYWRVEPGVKFHCDIDYDPFVFMAINNKTYGFTIAPTEGKDTVTTLYETTKDFVKKHPNYVNKGASMHFITNANTNVENLMQSRWNLCHFWSNFEIGDLRFWRSKEYMEYFEYLDKAGGFFYERWGDAPVHTLAVALFLDRGKLHHFDDIGYYHPPWGHCPRNKAYHESGRCDCDPKTVSRRNRNIIHLSLEKVLIFLVEPDI